MSNREAPELDFVNLHVHTTFSIFDGLGYPEDFARSVHQRGMNAVAITDHGNMNALVYQVEAYKKLKREGKEVKPIFGIEAYFIPSLVEWQKMYDSQKKASGTKKKLTKTEKEDLLASASAAEDQERFDKKALSRRSHLLLLAKNQKGLNNLFSLVSKSYKYGFYRYPRIDYKMLKRYSEGIIATSACIGGPLAQEYYKNKDLGHDAILSGMREVNSKFRKIFGDDWYLELQWNSLETQREMNKYILQLHAEEGTPLISTCDAHFFNPELWQDQILYNRLGWLGKQKIVKELPETLDKVGYHLYPKNGDEIWEEYQKCKKRDPDVYRYSDSLVRESIQNTCKIAYEVIEDFLPEAEIKLPSFIIPEGKDENFLLSEIAFKALDESSHHDKPNYRSRLERELDVICSRGFAGYFLTQKAIIDIARREMLIGPGRGSAAGCLLSFLLGITKVDPIRWGLQFERFMLKDATGFADIDVDYTDPVKLKEILIKEWGENSVVPISNFNTLQLRSLIKDISKFYKVPFSEVNSVTSKMLIEATPAAKRAHGIRVGVYAPTYQEVIKYSPSLQGFLKKYPKIDSHIGNLVGMIRSTSTHAAGVIISENLEEVMPLIAVRGSIQTPWCEGQHVRHLEPMGLIKFDILGLSTLAMIEKTIRGILSKETGKEPSFAEVSSFYEKKLSPETIDLEDSKVWKTIFRNKKKMGAGIFQLSGAGAQIFCANVKPLNIDEFSAVTAIYRPGPLASGVDKTYLNAKTGSVPVRYEHPILKELLSSNYGHIIYQEDIASIIHRLGKDISLDEGNKFRKLLTKAGAGDSDIVREKLQSFKERFIEGCREKAIPEHTADEIYKRMEYFSSYGFNKSHSISYSLISYTCAWLSTYYPDEWAVSFLDKEPEKRKAKATSVVRALGYKIRTVDVNNSPSLEWAVSTEEGKTLVQPLSAIKGLGATAIEQIMLNRPFQNIEQLIFNENVTYSKLNKKALDVLSRSGALSGLMDSRFSGLKHFWSCVAVDRAKSLKSFESNIQLYSPEGDFEESEKIGFISDLTGYYPIDKIVTAEKACKLEKACVLPISKWERELRLVWFVPVTFVLRQTLAKKKHYYIVTVVDDRGSQETLKIWGVSPLRDAVPLNKLCMAKLDYSEKWGFSLRNMSSENFRSA